MEIRLGKTNVNLAKKVIIIIKLDNHNVFDVNKASIQMNMDYYNASIALQIVITNTLVKNNV